jgi:thiamine pyrophosphate-dependent acetolactate synthase large subunit-like protein
MEGSERKYFGVISRRVGKQSDGGYRIHCSIDPPPDYVGIAAAAGGAVGWKVEKVEDLVPALENALEAVKGGNQALLDVWLPKF